MRTGSSHPIAVLLSCLVAAGAAAAPPVEPASLPARGVYVIVHASHLAEAAGQWAAYRAADGWEVVLRDVKPGRPLEKQRADLLRTLRELHEAARSGNSRPLFVLLLGDASPDDARGVPTWTIRQTDPIMQSRADARYATDQPYQLMDEDEIPDLALGRIPVATNAEALAVLEKTKQYEARPPLGPWRRRVTYVAGEGHFGLMDGLLEQMFRTMVDQFVPDTFDVSVTYAKASSIYCPPPSALTDTVLARLGEGSLLFNYIGHGTATRFDSLHWGGRRIGMLSVDDLSRLPAPGAGRAIALLTCCEAGWFDLPRGRRSLAEAMLLHPDGPVAVIAGSRITHPYANTVLQKDLSALLFRAQVETVGELDRRATADLLVSDESDRDLDSVAAAAAVLGRWASTLDDLRRMHAGLYNLLGDPALRIAHPPRLDDLLIDGRRIRGRADGIVRGDVHIAFETARASMARPDLLEPPTDAADTELERKARVNYPLVNDRILLEVGGEIRDGRFVVALDEDLPARTEVVKVWVSGADEQGRPREAFGARRVAATEQPAE